MTSDIPPDDSSLDLPLPDDLVLWRRVPKLWKAPVDLGDNVPRSRPSSASFDDHRDGSSMSVYDSNICGGLETILAGHDGFGVAALTVGQMRAEGMTVIRTRAGGAGHCEVIGKKTKAVKDHMAKAAVWVREP